MGRNYDVMIFISIYLCFILKEPLVANFADIIKIAVMLFNSLGTNVPTI